MLRYFEDLLNYVTIRHIKALYSTRNNVMSVVDCDLCRRDYEGMRQCPKHSSTAVIEYYMVRSVAIRTMWHATLYMFWFSHTILVFGAFYTECSRQSI